MQAKRIGWTGVALSAIVASAAWAGDYRLEKRLDLAAGGSFSLRSEAGDVALRGGDGSQAVVTITSDREDFAELFVVRFETPRPDRVEVVIERKSKGPASWFGSFRSKTHVEVALPRSAAAEVESAGGGVEIANLAGAVRAESSGGALHAMDLGGDAKLSSSGGRVSAERIQGALAASSSGGGVQAKAIGGTAKLDSSGGAIDAEEVGGDVDASSSGGGVHIRAARGAVVASSSGGPVSVDFAAGNAHGGRLDSSGGGVEARVDPAVGLEIDASSSGGRVASDLELTVQGKAARDSLRGKLNGGGALLRLRSSGGGITLAPR